MRVVVGVDESVPWLSRPKAAASRGVFAIAAQWMPLLATRTVTAAR